MTLLPQKEINRKTDIIIYIVTCKCDQQLLNAFYSLFIFTLSFSLSFLLFLSLSLSLSPSLSLSLSSFMLIYRRWEGGRGGGLSLRVKKKLEDVFFVLTEGYFPRDKSILKPNAAITVIALLHLPPPPSLSLSYGGGNLFTILNPLSSPPILLLYFFHSGQSKHTKCMDNTTGHIFMDSMTAHRTAQPGWEGEARRPVKTSDGCW